MRVKAKVLQRLLRSAGRLRCRFEGDAAVPSLLRASLCLFMRTAACGDRSNSESVGARYQSTRATKATLGKRRLLPHATPGSRTGFWRIDDTSETHSHPLPTLPDPSEDQGETVPSNE